MWSQYINVTDGQTDGQTTYHRNTALRTYSCVLRAIIILPQCSELAIVKIPTANSKIKLLISRTSYLITNSTKWVRPEPLLWQLKTAAVVSSGRIYNGLSGHDVISPRSGFGKTVIFASALQFAGAIVEVEVCKLLYFCVRISPQNLSKDPHTQCDLVSAAATASRRLCPHFGIWQYTLSRCWIKSDQVGGCGTYISWSLWCGSLL